MLTREQVLRAIRDGRESLCPLDNRDFDRLLPFFPVDDWEILGFKLKEGQPAPVVADWTRQCVLAQLEEADVSFGFEKALGHRSLSAESMHGVVLSWLWILEDPLYEEHSKSGMYRYYGLPLFKAAAVKYGFQNQIGDDDGNEDEYGDYGDYPNFSGDQTQEDGLESLRRFSTKDAEP